MKLIASFQVDHARIAPGVSVSRRGRVEDGGITTFGVRLLHADAVPAVHPNSMRLADGCREVAVREVWA